MLYPSCLMNSVLTLSCTVPSARTMHWHLSSVLKSLFPQFWECSSSSNTEPWLPPCPFWGQKKILQSEMKGMKLQLDGSPKRLYSLYSPGDCHRWKSGPTMLIWGCGRWKLGPCLHGSNPSVVQTLLVDDRFIYPPKHAKRIKIVMLMDLGHFSKLYSGNRDNIIIYFLAFLPSVCETLSCCSQCTYGPELDWRVHTMKTICRENPYFLQRY